MRLFIGLMSGTSMDGIDAALLDVKTNTLIAGMTYPYTEPVKRRLRAVMDGDHVLPAELNQLHTLIGRAFAQAVHQLLNKTNTTPEQIVAIGSHGQTICHDATAEIPYTVQLGCAHTIAALTGIHVVADFRTRDLVMGGQGAPFAPLYHLEIFGKDTPTAVINIGGIANVTFLSPDTAVSGYDTGPGNCLMDAWVYKHLSKSFDDNGAWGNTGTIIEPLLSSLLTDPYFTLPAPKSLDKAYFSEGWLAQHLRADYASQDVQATLVAFTATTISQAIKGSGFPIERIAICGGGVHNTTLLHAIRRYLPEQQIESTQYWGVDPDFLEAMMFAFLADKTVNHIPVDLTGITGAKRPLILGVSYFPC